ncbi:hypothetical protein [Rhizobium tumorigenes]|uniref:Uncharacterized protein n=1 Tax=Rhizobium tumorigenes TaxID=2041385 RepID=A0AAF1K3Y3_9HYPH|nr:hypothetical protein [Rhizobium tumorigenes]WFR95338.1 hypothetical protein PR017_16420 [Rhizobium tumorigenes]
MNKIVLEHYPLSKLPDDMRRGLDESATVKVVIEQDADQSETERWPGFAHLPKLDIEPSSIEQILEDIEKFRKTNPSTVSTAEAVARIRELRDEWDDE